MGDGRMLKKSLKTDADRAFWRACETAEKTVAQWPAWKRGEAYNAAAMRAEQSAAAAERQKKR